MWQELLTILQNLTTCYQQLLELNKKKHTILVMVKLEELEEIVRKEQQIAGEIQQAEQGRQGVLKQLAEENPKIRPETKLRELYVCCPEPELAAKLHALHEELETLVGQVKDAGENNEILITSALSAVKYRLNQLGSSAVEPTYGAEGQEKVSHQKKFDFRA